MIFKDILTDKSIDMTLISVLIQCVQMCNVMPYRSLGATDLSQEIADKCLKYLHVFSLITSKLYSKMLRTFNILKILLLFQVICLQSQHKQEIYLDLIYLFVKNMKKAAESG